MDVKNTRTLVKYAALVIVLAMVLMEEPTSIPVCNINANTLENFRPAVTGNKAASKAPSDECCIVLQVANLECICRFKSYLPVLATHSTQVEALLRKCGITTIPSACQGNAQL